MIVALAYKKSAVIESETSIEIMATPTTILGVLMYGSARIPGRGITAVVQRHRSTFKPTCESIAVVQRHESDIIFMMLIDAPAKMLLQVPIPYSRYKNC